MALTANRIRTFKIIPVVIGIVRDQLSRFLFLLLVISSLLLVYMTYSGSSVRRFVFDSYSVVISSAMKVLDAGLVSMGNGTRYLEELSNARYENIALKLENSRLQKLVEHSSHLYAENTSLKAHLQFINDLPVEYSTSARISDVALGIYNHSMLITAGAKNGISKNQVAISRGGIIGHVVEVGNSYARVMLTTDRQSRIPVISSVSGQRAILSGDGRSGGELLYMGTPDQIKIGEIIVSSGDGKYYPYGIPVAKVVEKIGSKVYVKPVAELSQAKFVSIIRESGE